MASEKILNILKSVNDKVQRLVAADRFYVALYDPVKAEIEFPLVAWRGKLTKANRAPWKRRAYQGYTWLTDAVIAQKAALLLEKDLEVELEKKALKYWPDGKLPLSWLGVPMLFEDRAVGVIVVENRGRVRAFGDNGVRVLTTVARQAAVALENAALYQRMERRRNQLETVREVTNAISAELELQECLERILDETTKLLGVEYATIQFIDQETDELVLQAHAGKEEIPPEFKRIKLGEGVTGMVAKEGWTIRTGDVESLEYYLDYFGKRTKSEMATPLNEHGEVIGVLNVEDPKKDAFDDEDEELFKLLAEQVVIAVQNAKRQERRVEMERFAYLGHVADGIAHRINNTIALLPLCTEDIRSKLPEVPPAVDENLAMIARNAQYILDLAEEFQRPSRPSEAGLFDINLLIQEAMGVASPQAITVVTELDDTLPKVQTKKLLIDVFVELITNAIEAMAESEEKVLEIGSRRGEDNSVEIWFTDTGKGIPEEEHERLFELFFTTAGKTEPDAGVTKGIGLWWIKTFLAWQDGDIWVESHVGKGATFVVKLPIEVV